MPIFFFFLNFGATDSSKRGKEFDPQVVNPILSEELFKEHVIPSLLQMFPSREIHVRHVLLQFFSGYVHLFEQKVLKGTILPLVSTYQTSFDSLDFILCRKKKGDFPVLAYLWVFFHEVFP